GGGVGMDRPGGEIGGQVGGKVAGGTVVGGDDQRTAPAEGGIVLQHDREQVGPQGRGDARGDALRARSVSADTLRQSAEALVAGGYVEQWSEAHGRRNDRTGSPAGPPAHGRGQGLILEKRPYRPATVPSSSPGSRPAA